jgi:hypothetical protein
MAKKLGITQDSVSLRLVAQGRTVAEALEIARDVARKLIEARREREDQLSFPTASDLQPLPGGNEKKSTAPVC